MQLKEAVFSALEELEQEIVKPIVREKDSKKPVFKEEDIIKDNNPKTTDEQEFLIKLKERLLVLFEGFQATNNKNVEAKLDLTLGFLEYLLSLIEERIEKIKPTDR